MACFILIGHTRPSVEGAYSHCSVNLDEDEPRDLDEDEPRDLDEDEPRDLDEDEPRDLYEPWDLYEDDLDKQENLGNWKSSPLDDDECCSHKYWIASSTPLLRTRLLAYLTGV